ncbi:MAG: Rho termination factor N-terminal domain-containing protein [Actinomycetota bacterium]|nr:Rho termination factor N-terminal domain-containing protein [Actinomycetota bacterium]
MSGEQQLERSVLESKERDELHAIAEALGLKPASRTTKANLVGQILRATGVDVEGNGETASAGEAREKASPNGFDAGGPQDLAHEVGLGGAGCRLEAQGIRDGVELVALLALQDRALELLLSAHGAPRLLPTMEG